MQELGKGGRHPVNNEGECQCSMFIYNLGRENDESIVSLKQAGGQAESTRLTTQS